MSFHFFYVASIRASIVALILWALAFVSDNAWLAKGALVLILILLLLSGTVLLFLGFRDLLRDVRHMLQERSHKKGHA